MDTDMQDETDQYIDRIIRYLADELSPAETRELQRWQAAHVDHQALYEAIETLWQASSKAPESHVFNSQADWTSIQPRLTSASPADVPAVVIRAVSWQRWAVAASIALLIGLGISLLPYSDWFGPAMETVATTRDQHIQTLPDGSIVTLNAGSQLRFPPVFTENKRRVSLQGEAFFEIAPKKERFVVETSSLLVEVRGTSFNVSAYAGDQPARVSVSSGQVQVSTPGSTTSPTMLSTGQQAILPADETNIRIGQAQVNDFSWKTGVLVFADTPLEVVVADISRHYQIQLSLRTPAMDSQRYTGRFAKTELSTVLETISLSMGLKISGNEQKGYVLAPAE